MRKNASSWLRVSLWSVGFGVLASLAGARPPLPPIVLPAAEAACVRRVAGHDLVFFARTVDKHGSFHEGRVCIDLRGETPREESFEVLIDQTTLLPVQYDEEAEELRGAKAPAPLISQAQAQATAEALLGRLGVLSHGGWQMTEWKYMDHGSMSKEYSFSWSKISRGVRLPAWIEVDVNAVTGKVYSYWLRDDQVTILLQARVTEDQAVQAVAHRMGWAHWQVERAWLDLWYRGGYQENHVRPQFLAWDVQISRVLPTPQVGGRPRHPSLTRHMLHGSVDALSGKVWVTPQDFWHPEPSADSPHLSDPSQWSARSFPVDLKAGEQAQAPPTVFALHVPRH